jgi:LPXTG-motif cell wall-anchored protein
MTVSATKVTEEPATVVAQQRQLSGSMPPAPEAPPADQPILVAVLVPATPAAAQEPATQEASPQQLPKTGSELPLVALFGCLSLAGSAGLRLFRKFVG